jgi:hypothetical protein
MLRNQNFSTNLDPPGTNYRENFFGSTAKRADGRSDVTGGDVWDTVNSEVVIPAPSSPPCRRRPRLPEMSLVTALLMDALRCVQAGDRGLSRGEFLEAYEWFTSGRRDWPFSFLNICDFLQVDATALRKRFGLGDNGNASRATEQWLKRRKHTS